MVARTSHRDSGANGDEKGNGRSCKASRSGRSRIWIDERGALALAHCRLSIGVSVDGHQPMQSTDGRFTVVFNGEVYNHLEIRAKLPNKAWRGRSIPRHCLRRSRPGESKIHCDT
ncbi:MAG: hypothetical protein IPN05_12805 [Sulfuritalea sp.]|nr:hypothetical protein [Sulfuritalea sp.]